MRRDAYAEISGWLFPQEATTLQRLAVEQQKRFELDFLEIGSWKGRSTVAIASVLEDDHRLWTIDHFRGNVEHQKGEASYFPPRFTRKNELWIYPDLLENIIRFEAQNRVVIVPLCSEKAAKVIDEKFCFAFFDGEHSYEAVSRDWELWHPHLVPGGIEIFHDYNRHPIKKFFDELRENKSLSVIEVSSMVIFRKEFIDENSSGDD